RSRAASKKHPTKKDQEFTVYPVLGEPAHLAYLANQGAIEIHAPTSLAADLIHPDRIVIDLDPPPASFARVRRAAAIVRDALASHGLASVPVATGSKGYHVVAPILPSVESDTIADVDRLLDRSDPLARLASAPSDAERFVAEVDAAFEASGLVVETFDRFRS